MSESVEGNYRSVLLDRDAAIAGSGIDAPVAAHYGAPTREQRSLEDGIAVVDRSHFDVLQLHGEDRLSWLDTLSTQKVGNLQPGDSALTLLLTLQGRIEHEIKVLAADGFLWLLTEPGRGAALASWLDSMRFMLRVSIEDVSTQYGLIASTTPIQALEAYPKWANPWPRISEGGYPYSLEQHPGLERDWYEYVVPLAELATAAEGLELAGMMAAEALRIQAWEPRFGIDTDEKTIPHEIDALRHAVHLSKGCYKGQETVARVHNLGHPPRRMVFLHLDGSEHTLPAPGSEVRLGERRVGVLTSSALHHEAGPIALALIKRTVPLEETLTVVDEPTHYAANQEEIVAVDSGQVAGRFTGFLRTPKTP